MLALGVPGQVLDHATGRTALLYEIKTKGGARASCFSAVPLAPRPKPTAIPGDCPQESGTGTFLVQDVYQGLLEQGVERGTVKRLRIMSQSPKKYNTEGFRYHDHYPLVGKGSYYVKNNHGTVPVDDKGSAYFKAPANKELYFIALDEHGKEVQRMGSVTQVTVGETSSCIGCHENRLAPPPALETGMARTRRPPDAIKPPSWGAGPVDYVRQVQPILDRFCIECHSGGEAKQPPAHHRGARRLCPHPPGQGSGVFRAGKRTPTIRVSALGREVQRFRLPKR